jgi:putative nucleotidyltransferase with HDIG domain
VCARVIAHSLGRPAEEAFTAGLLHDIGRLVLDANFHEDFSQVLEYREAHDCLLPEAERAVLGIDHATVGFEVARQWKFPLPVQAAIRDHHQPDAEPSPLTDVIHFANVLAHALEIGNAGYDRVPPLFPGAWERLGGDWEMLEASLPEIERLNAGANLLVAEGEEQA